MSADWKVRHNEAVVLPSAEERPLLVLLWATAQVASLHGGDYVLREGVADLLRGTRKLLNASWGPRLDMGTVDRQIVEIAEGIGYNLEIEEFE